VGDASEISYNSTNIITTQQELAYETMKPLQIFTRVAICPHVSEAKDQADAKLAGMLKQTQIV
jgi:hypothetical protein